MEVGHFHTKIKIPDIFCLFGRRIRTPHARNVSNKCDICENILYIIKTIRFNHEQVFPFENYKVIVTQQVHAHDK